MTNDDHLMAHHSSLADIRNWTVSMEKIGRLRQKEREKLRGKKTWLVKYSSSAMGDLGVFPNLSKIIKSG